MKTYTITVNGTAYEVTVEEGAGSGVAPVVKLLWLLQSLQQLLHQVVP